MFFCRFTVKGNFLRKSYQRFFLVGHIFSEGLCVFNELFVVRYTNLKFTSFPVWSLFIGFPHPPLRGPPSPKGRPTDTEAILFSVYVFDF